MVNIEEKNIREDIIEIFEKCNKCGLCKELCPVFRILREEQTSPRGQSILLSNRIFSELVYQCTLCKACEEKCPFNLKICRAMKRARQILAIKGEDPESLKKILKKVENKENAYL
jgi:glycolate oxidase iron-sulfur subunit